MKLPSFFILNFYTLLGDKNKPKDPKVMNVSAEPENDSDWIYNYFPKDQCIKRWKSGVTLYYLLNDKDQPCCFVWSRIAPVHYVGEINRDLVFSHDVHCFIDAITPPEHRGNGYYTYLMRAVADELSEYISIGYAYKTNIISNKGFKRSGYVHTHKFYCFFKFIKVKPIVKDYIKFHVK